MCGQLFLLAGASANAALQHGRAAGSVTYLTQPTPLSCGGRKSLQPQDRGADVKAEFHTSSHGTEDAQFTHTHSVSDSLSLLHTQYNRMTRAEHCKGMRLGSPCGVGRRAERVQAGLPAQTDRLPGRPTALTHAWPRFSEEVWSWWTCPNRPFPPKACFSY